MLYSVSNSAALVWQQTSPRNGIKNFRNLLITSTHHDCNSLTYTNIQPFRKTILNIWFATPSSSNNSLETGCCTPFTSKGKDIIWFCTRPYPSGQSKNPVLHLTLPLRSTKKPGFVPHPTPRVNQKTRFCTSPYPSGQTKNPVLYPTLPLRSTKKPDFAIAHLPNERPRIRSLPSFMANAMCRSGSIFRIKKY